MASSVITTSWTPLLVIALPLVGMVVAAVMRGRRAAWSAAVLVSLCVATVALVVSLVPGVLAGKGFELYVAKLTPVIWIYLRVDAMGVLFALTASVLWTLALVYSFGYMEGERHQARYYAFFMLCLACAMGIAFAGNLLTLLVAYEMFSVMTYPLVVHEETAAARAAGLKYIVYILIGGSLIMLAMITTYFVTRDQAFTARRLFSTGADPLMLQVIFWCLIAGFGVKAAVIPLHGWVADAHPAAPAPFSAILSGVMVAAGTFGIARVLFEVFGAALLRDMGVASVVVALGALSTVVAGVIACSQENLKRRLAYSTISQMGYVTMGLALLTPDSVTGALVHIANHAFMKGTLFLCAGLFIRRIGARDVSELSGVARRMPVVTGVFTVASFALVGLPPFAGLVSKWYLGLGMIQSDQWGYLVVLLGGSLLAALYLLPVVYVMYFGEPAEGAIGAAGAGVVVSARAVALMTGAAIVAGVLVVVLGVGAFMPGMPLSLAKLAVKLFIP